MSWSEPDGHSGHSVPRLRSGSRAGPGHLGFLPLAGLTVHLKHLVGRCSASKCPLLPDTASLLRKYHKKEGRRLESRKATENEEGLCLLWPAPLPVPKMTCVKDRALHPRLHMEAQAATYAVNPGSGHPSPRCQKYKMRSKSASADVMMCSDK